jgi:hypothetical protein
MFLIPNIEHFTTTWFTSYSPKNLPNPNAYNRFKPIINRDSKTDKITIEVHFLKKLLKCEYTYGVKFSGNDLKIVVERFAKELCEYALTYSHS